MTYFYYYGIRLFMVFLDYYGDKVKVTFHFCSSIGRIFNIVAVTVRFCCVRVKY